MSWEALKTHLSRNSNKIMKQSGFIHAPKDDEVEMITIKTRSLKKDCEKVLDVAIKFNKIMRVMKARERSIASAAVILTESDLSHRIFQTKGSSHLSCNSEENTERLNILLLDNLRKFAALFPDFEDLQQAVKSALLEHHYYASKITREPVKDLDKAINIQDQADKTKINYLHLKRSLVESFKIISKGRLCAFEPAFDAYLKMQLNENEQEVMMRQGESKECSSLDRLKISHT